MNQYLLQIKTQFRNMVLNAAGVEGEFLRCIEQGDISKAISMMDNHEEEVDEAIKEYNPQTHKVNERLDKKRKNDPPYRVEKLPRSRQKYINEVELFFLLGAPVIYQKKNGDDRAFAVFSKFIKDKRIHSLHRKFKRLAGSETEAALMYHLYSDNGEIDCIPYVAARSEGYQLRPLFDQYGTLLAFACGYQVRKERETAQRWDIYTPTMIFECEKNAVGWDINARENILGKNPVIYARQAKSWDGVEKRIHREEMIDSKAADTNNYFADPVAYATADVVSLMGADKDMVGRLIQFTGNDSKFGYIAPPQDSQSRQEERDMLQRSILFDTFTPDLSYESIKGLGSLSGDAIENSLLLGEIKRQNRLEIYGELFDRECNIIKDICSIMHPELNFRDLEIEVEFQSPFSAQKSSRWADIVNVFSAGLVSLETAVEKLAITDKPEEEVARIKIQTPKE